ncbi:MAG: hypothetical protein FJY92_04420 [Candidatus Hydrogenedentes bacterium]|nr:hypothetical protein [Candidatus Hydrogenedentota bacterium]
MDCTRSRAEELAVEGHRNRLSFERGTDVTVDEALSDWDANCAARWREERQRAYMAEQRAEIERHKWIESEKAGRDLGRDAVLDWIANNAAAWRNWYESREEAVR